MWDKVKSVKMILFRKFEPIIGLSILYILIGIILLLNSLKGATIFSKISMIFSVITILSGIVLLIFINKK